MDYLCILYTCMCIYASVTGHAYRIEYVFCALISIPFGRQIGTATAKREYRRRKLAFVNSRDDKAIYTENI